MGVGIYDKKRKTLKSDPDDRGNKLFELFLNRKGQYFKGKELAKKFNTSEATISREMKKLCAEEHTWGQETYRIEKTEEGYVMKVTYQSEVYQIADTDEKKPGRVVTVFDGIEKLDNPKIWKAEAPLKINDHVIMFEISVDYFKTVKSLLAENYSEFIYAILRDGTNMYIILKDLEESKLKTVRKVIMGLYGGEDEKSQGS